MGIEEKKSRGQEEGPGPGYCALSVPTLATSHLCTQPGALTLSVPPSLPPSALLQKLCKWAAPSPRLGVGRGQRLGAVLQGLDEGAVRAVWMAGLQWLVTLLLQVTVVVFLGRQWHAVQGVMSM